MKRLLPLVSAAALIAGAAGANENYLGAWSSGASEVLKITRDGDALTAEFVRENVKAELEKVRFPAKLQDGILLITGEQGDVPARYDKGNQLLILGGIKSFQRLTPEQAVLLIENLINKSH